MDHIKTEYITLQQYLKFIGIADTGGQAKILVKQLDIRVNGEKEDRRGRKLYPNDTVVINGKKYIVE